MRVERNGSEDGVALTASHDGYRAAFGLVHERRWRLAADGQSLHGEDRLIPRRGQSRRPRRRRPLPPASRRPGRRGRSRHPPDAAERGGLAVRGEPGGGAPGGERVLPDHGPAAPHRPDRARLQHAEHDGGHLALAAASRRAVGRGRLSPTAQAGGSIPPRPQSCYPRGDHWTEAMPSDPKRVTRALLSVSDKSGLVEFARALARSRRRPRLDRRHEEGARRGRPRRAGCVRPDRLSRDDGRPRQDAPSRRAWRAPRRARQPGAPGRHAGARHRADRSARRQPLPVRGDARGRPSL